MSTQRQIANNGELNGKNIEHAMEARILEWFVGIQFPKVRGPFQWSPVPRIVLFGVIPLGYRDLEGFMLFRF